MKIAFVGNFEVSFSSENHHAQSLEALGHEVVKLQEGKRSAQEIYEKARTAEILVWIHTHGWETKGNVSEAIAKLKDAGVVVISYHLDLWLGLEREKDLNKDPFYTQLDYFFATDKLMCDYFNEHTKVKGVYVPAGVFHKEAYMAQFDGNYKHDVIFVGSRGYHPEWQYRPMLIDWLKDTYGANFAHFGGDGLGVVRGHKLNHLYTHSKVAVGDTLCHDFEYPHYFSDRLFETTGRGGFLIFPYIKGLEEQFEIDREIVTYQFGNFAELREKIDYYVRNDAQREAIRKAGHERAKNNHTYMHRWERILNEVRNTK